MHAADNQLHEDQPQEHHPAPQAPQDTAQDIPQEHHGQQNQAQAQQGLPQTHDNLPPGHQEGAQVQNNLP